MPPILLAYLTSHLLSGVVIDRMNRRNASVLSDVVSAARRSPRCPSSA